MDRYNPLSMHVALKRLTVYERPFDYIASRIYQVAKTIATNLHYRLSDNKELQRRINQSATVASSSPPNFLNSGLKLGKTFYCLFYITPSR